MCLTQSRRSTCRVATTESRVSADTWLERLSRHERLNFLLTNRIPRRWATLAVGRLSRIEHPLVARFLIGVWRLFATDLDLSEARRSHFRSMQECFTRELREGARPVDPDPAVLASPCDAIVGACGEVRGTEVLQAKGYPYTLGELLREPALVERYRDGLYVTLRLKSSFYHRFHAPTDCRVRRVTYISGDTWNVNPVALERIERLYCRNERAVIDLDTGVGGEHLTLVAVAAILVASIRLHCLPEVLDLRYKGPNHLRCDAAFAKGEEMGMFLQGSTIIVFADPGCRLADGVAEGARLRMGEPLLRRTGAP